MMEVLTLWLRQVVAAAFFSAAMAALIPAGVSKRIAMLCCSLLLLTVLFRPLLGEIDLSRLDRSWQAQEQEILDASQQLQQSNRERWETLIAEELVSYIETRAAQEGIHCTVRVTLDEGEDGVPRPCRIELTASQRSETLHRCIREDLGMTEEQIQWRIG